MPRTAAWRSCGTAGGCRSAAPATRVSRGCSRSATAGCPLDITNRLVVLTIQLVMTKKKPPKPDLGTRDRLFAAAAAEFAARGFAGANVDRIAQAARVNKAMLYYHFKSKAGLYGEILRDMFGAVAGRLAEATPADADPRTRVRIMVETIAHAAEARPHFPPIWLREIAEGGAHIDPDTIAIVARILE